MRELEGAKLHCDPPFFLSAAASSLLSAAVQAQRLAADDVLDALQPAFRLFQLLGAGVPFLLQLPVLLPRAGGI
jgi:hypothetical protein